MSNANNTKLDEQKQLDQTLGLIFPDGIDKSERRVWFAFFELIRYMYLHELIEVEDVSSYLSRFTSIDVEEKESYYNSLFQRVQEKEKENAILEEYTAHRLVTDQVDIVSRYLTADQIINLIELINDRPLPQEAKDQIRDSKKKGLMVTEDDIQYLADTATQRYIGREGLRIDDQGTRASFTNTKPLTMEDLGRYIETGKLGGVGDDDAEDDINMTRSVNNQPPRFQPSQDNTVPTPPQNSQASVQNNIAALPIEINNQQFANQNNLAAYQSNIPKSVQQPQVPIVAPLTNKPLPSTAANLRQANRSSQDFNTLNQSNIQNPNIPANRNQGLDALLEK